MSKIELTAEELQAKIDEAVDGLKTKNNELLAELKKARKGSQIDPEELARVESERDDLKSQLTAAQKEAGKLKKAAEDAAKQYQTESAFTEKLLKQNGLAEALAKNGVAPQFMDAAQALLAGKVQIVVDGDNRVAKMGDKALLDAVKEWAGSDQGKHFVAAPANGGGGASGGGGKQEGAKTVTRTQFEGMDHAARVEFSKGGGKVVDA